MGFECTQCRKKTLLWPNENYNLYEVLSYIALIQQSDTILKDIKITILRIEK